jgi:hypothetical protein
MAKRVGLTRSRVVRAISPLMGLALVFGATNVARADWWAENFEFHGKANSTVYFNSPSLSNDFQMDQWMNSLEMNFDVKVFEDSSSSLTFHSIITPTYDAVYDIYPAYFGDRRKGAQPGTQSAALAEDAIDGKQFPGHGACIRGGFCDQNQDTGFAFTGRNNPQFIFDNTIFFGDLGAASRSRSSGTQGRLGGAPSVFTFNERKRQALASGSTPANNAFIGTMNLAKANGSVYKPLHSFNPAGDQYVLGDRYSIEHQFVAGINHTDGQLQTRCFDGAHDWCWAREAYFEGKWNDTQIRIGRQQVVWGKTDAFRLQDLVNPIDFGSHNVYPSLEERRIPSLSVDLVQSFGTLGPLEDASLEIVWVVDKFKPVQVGQCGDFWAFTAACESRADAGGHGLLNQSLAKVEQREWTFANTEPGFRFEGRFPDPSISFSISGFWGIQDIPVARFVNGYKTTNPNPAMMLFLQGLGFGAIDPPNTPPAGIIPVFDPYDRASIQAASDAALGFWGAAFGSGGFLCDNATLGQNKHAKCIAASGVQPLGWMWSASQAVIEYPRTFTLGGSLDYQIPNVDTVLRLETSYDFSRSINNTNEFDGVDKSDVISGAIGLDRSFFIPILNKDRTAFVSFQTFIEHVMNHDGNATSGMVERPDNIISTFFIENYWRSDSIVLTNFFAYDWSAKAWITGPKLKWVMNDQISFEVGVNLLQGSTDKFNISNICKDGQLKCLADPTTWQAGNWQLINENFRKTAEAPWWGRESFADNMMENRDEVWAGVTYQF